MFNKLINEFFVSLMLQNTSTLMVKIAFKSLTKGGAITNNKTKTLLRLVVHILKVIK